MAKLNLEFKLKTVRNLEKKTGKGFFDIFSNLSITTLADVLAECGLDDAAIEQAFGDYGIDGVITAVMEGLKASGFLPKAMEIPKLSDNAAPSK